jgi:hypothetical protein
VNRHHNVEQLTKDELERVKRELQANLGLITPVPLRTRQSRLICTQSTQNSLNAKITHAG